MKPIKEILKSEMSVFWRLFCWVIAPAAFWLTIVTIIILLFVGCATQKELHEHQTHVITADTLAQEAHHDGHHQQQTANLDSIVTASVWQAMQELVKSEQEHEIVTETLTETVDSLGRVIRQQQKTTDRTVSRQELQRQKEQLQQMANELRLSLSRMDSTWSDRFSKMETTMRDSIDAVKDKQSQTSAAPAASWMQRTWSWLWGILLGLAISAAVFIYLKATKKI